ncbi:MAG: MGH1-like glycoside hydrolase domain-containing protein [Solirubrobacteraceae bacterium]
MPAAATVLGPEHERLAQAREGKAAWKAWGPYLSERQWGTVREDYSPDGEAWSYFTHDHARSRAYRWGEDGIAGICDERQRLCLALALWNANDPILKERMFGLSNGEGNHGEDVKEYWFYLDSTPTHSYLKCQYKYPQSAFPYYDLVATNGRRGKQDMEYELLDTGIFDDDRYFDVVVEYAKAAPDDILMLVTAHNRGPEPATLHLLPTLWFRNTWSWGDDSPRPSLAAAADDHAELSTARASHPELGDWLFCADPSAQLLFCENETNNQRLFGTPNAAQFVKDGINDFVVKGVAGAVNPEKAGTKLAAHHVLELDPGDSASIRVRLTATPSPPTPGQTLAGEFDEVMNARRSEANRFYASVIPSALTPDQAMVMRQALAGMLWSKQYYEYDVHRWLREHGVNPWDPKAPASAVRNVPWFHMVAEDIISMPDKWEYPWFAAWDLAFHCAPLSLVDVDFAKEQVELLLRTRYMHANGQVPAYEWNFSDVNPPVTAWAALFVYEREAEIRGEGDIEFLKLVFDRLLANFTWWINRKDPDGRNLFQGGFLGLDNIGVFDRSAPLPGGGTLEQADGTAWMALYSQWMLQIAVELAKHDRAYVDMAIKFTSHFLWIAVAMNPPDRDTELWDEQDGLYYDVMRMPDGKMIQLKVRSLVGLLPLCAATVFDGELIERYPWLLDGVQLFIERFSDTLSHLGRATEADPEGKRLLALVDEDRLRQMLTVMLHEGEFLGAHGIRAVSRRHLEHPYRFDWAGQEYEVHYLPAESDTGMFGGNSNWRGPVWFPMNLVILRGLVQLHRYYGDRLTVECPTGSGRELNLLEVAAEISRRLVTTFTEDEHGHRPVFGGIEKFQADPNWHDLLLFHEYFHGDNGAGIGASHQTGWTGTVALLFLLAGARLTDAATIAAVGE